VLRSILWKLRKDFSSATQTAGFVGRTFGQILIGGGILLLLLVGAPGGLWLALIGWFVMLAAQSETSMVAMRDAFAGMSVADLMVRDPATVPTALGLRAFVDRVFPMHRYNAYPVIDDHGRASGILPTRNVKAAGASRWESLTVADCMIPLERALVMSEGKDLGEAVVELIQTDLGRALVMRDGLLVGLLSITDAERMLELHTPRRAGESPADGSPAASGR
jgi:CBS domain-containing protein